jgi:predicted PolB exonuclease-like 3'-5' exonuclease
MIITFDIETLPTDNADVIADMAKNITPPGTIKKPESIAAWHAENGAQALSDAVAKTSFDGALGRIACIAWAIDDGDIHVTQTGDEEEDIRIFYDCISKMVKIHGKGGDYSQGATFCGHNLAGFDLPFLKHRSIVLGIKPPPDILKAMGAKPWDSCIADTMLMWSSDSQKRTSMDKLCRALGIKGKDGFDGSMVSETWPIDPNKVREYCKDDVMRTRAMYKRITFAD